MMEEPIILQWCEAERGKIIAIIVVYFVVNKVNRGILIDMCYYPQENVQN